MHRFIAIAFANIVGLIHCVSALVFGLLILAAMSGDGPLVDQGPFLTGFVIIGVVFAYILIFGVTSVVIRTNQNLERIADMLEAGVQPSSRPSDDAAMPSAFVDAHGRREPTVSASR